jgi:hypothetical protein
MALGDPDRTPNKRAALQPGIDTERVGNAIQVTKGTTEDCNDNGVPDADDIAGGLSTDCNFNGIPDECDIASGSSVDADGDSYPDDCSYFALVPVPPPPPSTATYPPGVVIHGSQIVLFQGGLRVWMEVRLGGWGPRLLDLWQGTLDPSGYTSGEGAPIGPAFAPCSVHTDCEETVGSGVCDDRCANTDWCWPPPCSDGSSCEWGFCKPGFQDCERPDGVFFEPAICDVLDRSTPHFRFGGIAGEEPGFDDGLSHYGFTLAFDVPVDAAGTYTIDFDITFSNSLLSFTDGYPRNCPVGYTKPAQITVCSGQDQMMCCLPWGECRWMPPECCELVGGRIPIPAVSSWGLAVLGLLVLIAARFYYSPRSNAQHRVC